MLAPAGAGAGAAFSSLFDARKLDEVFLPASLCLAGTLFVTLGTFALKTGRMRRMVRTVHNIVRSPLSKVVFLLCAGTVLYLAAAYLYYFREEYHIEPEVILYLFWLASAAALVSIFPMRSTYNLRSTPLWTGSRLLAMLTGSAFMLGPLGAMLILHIFAEMSFEDASWHLMLIFFAALFADILHLNELCRLRRKVSALVLGLSRAPIYLSVFHLTGHIDVVRFAIMLTLSVAGEIVVRLFLFREKTESFQTELARVREMRVRK